MNYLIDTCVLSELRKRPPDTNVLKWINGIAEDRLFLSVITLGEIQKGISSLPISPKKDELQAWLDQGLTSRFVNRILTIDIDSALGWGILSGEGAKRGLTPPVVDSLIAATAIRHNLTLVTRNIADFAAMPVRTLNPWE